MGGAPSTVGGGPGVRAASSMRIDELLVTAHTQCMQGDVEGARVLLMGCLHSERHRAPLEQAMALRGLEEAALRGFALEEARAVQRRREMLLKGEEDSPSGALGLGTWEKLQCQLETGCTLLAGGAFSRAEPLLREVLTELRRALGGQHPQTLSAMLCLSLCLLQRADAGPEALAQLQECVDTLDVLLEEQQQGAPDSLRVLRHMAAASLAWALLSRQQEQQALLLLEPYAATAATEAAAAEASPSVDAFLRKHQALMLLGCAKLQAGQLEAAREILEECRSRASEVTPSPERQQQWGWKCNAAKDRLALALLQLRAHGALASTLRQQGELYRAQRLCWEALRDGPVLLGQALPATETPDAVGVTAVVGGTEEGQVGGWEAHLHAEAPRCGDVFQFTSYKGAAPEEKDAGALLEQEDRWWEEVLGGEDPLAEKPHVAAAGMGHSELLAVGNTLGVILFQRGKVQKARLCLERCLRLSRRLWGHSHPLTLSVCGNLCAVLREDGYPDTACRRNVELLQPAWRVLMQLLLQEEQVAEPAITLGQEEGEPLPITLEARLGFSLVGKGHEEAARVASLLPQGGVAQLVRWELTLALSLARSSPTAAAAAAQLLQTGTVPLAEHVLGEEHALTLELYRELGCLLVGGGGDREEGRALIRRSWRGFEEHATEMRVQRALSRWVEHLAARGHEEEEGEEGQDAEETLFRMLVGAEREQGRGKHHLWRRVMGAMTAGV